LKHRGGAVKEWIAFEEGRYLAEDAFLVTPVNKAVRITSAIVTVYLARSGVKHLRGSGLVRPFLLVELGDDSDHMDLILDFGGEHKYRLRQPEVKAGKVFAPDVQSRLQFHPRTPWEKLDLHEFEEWIARLTFLDIP
jgi:hypothetical protein